MDYVKKNWEIMATAGTAVAVAAYIYSQNKSGSSKKASVKSEKKEAKISKPDKYRVLIGDIGGTNVRLQLIEVDLKNGGKRDLK